MLNRPTARSEGLVQEWIDGGLVIYDVDRQVAHSLTGTTAAVWAGCDGATTLEDLAAGVNATREDVERAVSELERCGLLEGPPVPTISRRTLGKRMAQAGGAAFAGPLIYSLAIGPASAAASACHTNGSTCTSSAQCCSATCTSGKCCGTRGAAAPAGSCTVNSDCCSGGTCFRSLCY